MMTRFSLLFLSVMFAILGHRALAIEAHDFGNEAINLQPPPLSDVVAVRAWLNEWFGGQNVERFRREIADSRGGGRPANNPQSRTRVGVVLSNSNYGVAVVNRYFDGSRVAAVAYLIQAYEAGAMD